jgi:uncharacterized protein (TIGR02118 family)
MARLVVMYGTPKDLAAFDKYYFETHVPIARKIPGLRKYEVSQGPVAAPAGPSNYHLIATLHFDDLAAIQKAFASAEGKAAAAKCKLGRELINTALDGLPEQRQKVVKFKA